MNVKKAASTFVMLMLISLATSAMAQQGNFPNQGNRTPIWDRPGIAEELNLTADQAAALRRNQQTFRAEQKTLRTSMQTLRLELDDLLAADTVDADTVRQKAKELSALKSQIGEKSVEHRLALREILTAEQYSRLQQLRDQWRNSRRGNRGQRGGDRGPDR